MRQMRERNQISVAIVGTLLAVVLVLVSINLGKIGFLHPSHVYHAQFANADGIKSGDDVRVEGISVGSVNRVRVQGDHVLVDFTVKSGLHLGDQSQATIEVATILGNLFLQVESAGTGRLAAGGTIPLNRTTVPYTVIDALQQFGSFSKNTDLTTLRSSLSSLAQTISGISPKTANDALQGLASISETLASKQDQVEQILTSTQTITDSLNDNSAALVGLLSQGDDFLKMLQQRQQVISELLTDTAQLGAQLAELMQRNGAQLSSLLSNLNSVSAVLAKQKDQLATAVSRLGQFSVNIANVTGSGPWLDLLTPVTVIPDNMIVGCGTHPTGSGPCG
jgi:phospholipid/cholesterol/gamma-HCH transport system substrate-binding protein